jgi:hypothetical protein
MGTGSRVEIFLNLAWAIIALFLVYLWMRFGGDEEMDRRRQVIALMILIAILLPVISVSDDLMALQNATETDIYQRRDQLAHEAHTLIPAVAILAVAVLEALPFGFLRFVSPSTLPLRVVQQPERTAIQNRPPPAV